MTDASVLVAAIEAQHPDPFRDISRDALLRQAARADLSDGDVRVVELLRLLAMLGPRNGHTAIHPVDAHPTTQHAYPLGLYELEDGVFVIDAHRAELVGAELVAIGGVDIARVLEAVTPLVAHDNEWTIRERRSSFLVWSEILRGLGVIDGHCATFRVRAPDGSVVDLALDPVPAARHRSLPSEPHRVERSADGRIVHVSYDVTRGDTTGFARDVESVSADSDVRLLALDLRRNGGGDNRTYAPLLEVLQRLGDTKRLAVLTSRTTFSAAMQLVVDLERTTSAVFVGEPTGGSPNQYGDATPVPLPTSGLRAHVATIAWTTAGASDERLTREPDIPVLLDSTKYFTRDDAVLGAAIAGLT